MLYVNQNISSFTATNLTESVSAWSSATAYAVGNYALKGVYIYKCVSAHTNKDPEEYNGIYWSKWDVSNKYAMLDLKAQTKSTYAGNMYVEFSNTSITSIGVGYFTADTVLVEVLRSGLVVWSHETETAVNDNVYDYWDYIYEDYTYSVDRSMYIPLQEMGDTVRVTFNAASGLSQTSCGFLVGGIPNSIGETIGDVGFSFNSFATKEFDSFGSINIVKRGVQDIVDFETAIPSEEVIFLKRQIRSVYDDIIMFVIDDRENSQYDNMVIRGVIQDASVLINEFDTAIMSFTILEVI